MGMERAYSLLSKIFRQSNGSTPSRGEKLLSWKLTAFPKKMQNEMVGLCPCHPNLISALCFRQH
jgi:hypothetical protein